MGKGGRFGKYGEHKRFDRLRQSRDQKLRMTKNIPRGKTIRDLPYQKQEEGSKENKGTVTSENV